MFKALMIALLLATSACGITPEYASEKKMEEAPLIARPKPTVVIGYIVKVYCISPDLKSRGTAFYIGDGKFVTAHHVISGTNSCYEEESMTKLIVERVEESKDIALIKVENATTLPKNGFIIDCEGYKTNKIYSSFGYAGGEVLLMNNFKATKSYTSSTYTVDNINRSGMRELEGYLIPGMSGGPITNDEGGVTGINNVTAGYGTKAYSYELKHTFLCPKEDK